MLRISVALLALSLALASSGVARAAPTVTIKARADVALQSVRRTDDGRVQVKGTLQDRTTGAGLGGEEVELRIGAAQAQAITRPDGTFDAILDAVPGPIDVTLDFHGGTLIEAATFTDRVDPSKAAVDLTISTTVSAPGVVVLVSTAADGVAIAVPIAVRITPADADEPHRDLQLMSGRPVTIARADALGPGTRRIQAKFAGDAAHAPASASTVVELGSETVVTASVGDTASYDATIRVRGQVTDGDKRGVGKVTLTLVDAQKRRLGSATSGDGGKFTVSVEASLLGAGRHGLVVVATPREAWLKPNQSPVLFVTVGQPRPAPVAITIAAFAATVLTALGFIWARRRRQAPRPTDAAAASPGAEVARGGLEVARPGLVSTLRRAADHGFAGVVRDSVRHRPVPGAEVVITLGADVRVVTTSDSGAFAHEALSGGEWTARCAAPGHVSERFTVTIPHRGELRGARIDLVPVRERAFAIYRSAALPLLPRAELWGIWSPRQIVDHVRSARPPAALTALTALIEEIYFSSRVADETVLPEVETAARAAIAERATGIAV